MKKYKKAYNFYVYILTNKAKTVLYTGVTNNLMRRIREHKSHNDEKAFTARYNVFYIVYYEQHQYILNAIEREKEIKKFKRAKKNALIEYYNPNWDFLFEMEIDEVKVQEMEEEASKEEN